MFLKVKALSFALSGTALLVLSACGGGSDGDIATTPETPTTPASVVVTGTVVVDQAIRNAVVCMDLNASSTCDANEPASAGTGSNGAYSITYDSAKVAAAQAASASLIVAMVPGAAADATTTLDASDTSVANTTKSYMLKQVAGKGGQINPLTTLVAAGMAQGMSESVARANVAVQLAINEAKIDNYQDDPAFDPALVQDNARMMAKVTAAALEAGATLEVGDQTAAFSAAAGDLATLRYLDAANYYVRTLNYQDKPAGPGPLLVTDARRGRTGGFGTPSTSLYTQAYLSSAGWVYCNADMAIPTTIGKPSRSNYCNSQPSVGFSVASDVSGQTMAAVVTDMQADATSNVINNGVSTSELLTALGSAAFPADASVKSRTNFNLTRPISISNINTDIWGASITKLEQVVATYPRSKVNVAANTGTLSLGLGTSATTSLRVAFGDATSFTTGTAYFYECDLNEAQTAISNCGATQTGTWSIDTVNGARVLRFAGHTETVMSYTRVFSEVNGLLGTSINSPRVFSAREAKGSLTFSQSSSKRLNSTAWSALSSQLGI